MSGERRIVAAKLFAIAVVGGDGAGSRRENSAAVLCDGHGQRHVVAESETREKSHETPLVDSLRLHWLIVAVLFSSQAAWPLEEANAQNKLFDPKQGLDTFHIGNSLTDTTGNLAQLLHDASVIHKYDLFTAGGNLTWQLWETELPKRQKEWDDKLALYNRIDHFTIQPRDFTNDSVDHEADYAIRFFDLIRKHSPDMQPWFYAEWVEKNRQWPPVQGKIPSRQMSQTHPALSWEEAMAAVLLYNEDLQAKVVETYKGRKRPRVLPSCLAMGWIKNMIDHGKLPDAAKGSFYPLLFADDVHLNINGGYLVDLTWYAAFYGKSPEGEVSADGMPAGTGLPKGTSLTRGQEQAIQKLAWDVVLNYPDCGLYKEGTTPVAVPEFLEEGEPVGKTRPLTLTSKTPGAWFRYTLDDTPPTRTRGYVYCGVINVPAGATLKAIAYKSGMADSAVALLAGGRGQ